MGTITQLKSKTKGTRYRAVINIRRKKDGINYYDSETFSSKSLAKEWLKKEEEKLEKNPILMSTSSKFNNTGYLTLERAIERYLDEVKNFGRSKIATLKLIQKFDIAQIDITKLTRMDITVHAQKRFRGYENCSLNLPSVQPSTILYELRYIKSVLDHAELAWGYAINFDEYEKALKGLRKARIINESRKREILPTCEELQKITRRSYVEFHLKNYTNTPIYLIVWLAIYTGRRLNELTRLRLADYDKNNKKWFLTNIKNPNGSEGNNKWFKLTDKAVHIINKLLDEPIRTKMLLRGGDPGLLIPINADTIDRSWQKIKKIENIEHLRFHDLRHEAATRLAESGMSIPQMQQYTLHSDWNSLKRYVNLNGIRSKVLEFEDAMQFVKQSSIQNLL